jgi:hypothetical protein
LPAGDANCSTDVDLDDVTAVLGDLAGLGAAPCRSKGNVKCNDGLDGVDALFILEDYAGLDVDLPQGCPAIG